MLRVDTTLATFESDAFTPTEDIVLQAAFSPLANPTIAIQSRNDAAAPWSNITLWRPTNQPFMKVSTGVEVRLRCTRNIAGQQLRVWDDA